MIEMFWNEINVVVTEHYECTNCQWILHVKMAKVMSCEFQFLKNLFKNLEDKEEMVRNKCEKVGKK